MTSNKKFGMVLLLILFVSAIGLYLYNQGSFSTTAGVSVLSVSAPNVQSNSDLKNLNWLITTRLGGSDNILFTLTPSDMTSRTGVESTRTFKATADSIDETLKYSILAKNDFSIYTYTVTDIIDVDVNCGAAGGTVIAEPVLDRLFFSDQKFCVIRNLDGRYGTISDATQKFEADLSISNGVDTIKQTISSDVSSVDFRKNGQLLGVASWQGSLVTGNAAPQTPDIAILQSQFGKQWKFTSQSKFNQYQSAQNTFENDIQSLVGQISSTTSFSTIKNELQQKNSLLSNTRSNTIYNFETLDSDFRLDNPTSSSSAALIFDSDLTLTNPIVTWWIRADWLGVERLTGDPQITSISSPTFSASEQGIITVSVKNNGDDSVFVATLQSCSGFTQSTTSQEKYVRSGQSETMTVFLDAGNTNTDLSRSCSVRVFDKANPSADDVDTVRVTFEATKVCQSNAYSADFALNQILRCQSDGLGLQVVKQCSTGTSVQFTGQGSTGGYECVSNDQTGGVQPDTGFNRPLFIITILLALAGGVYTGVITPSRKVWVRLVVGGIVFIAIFLFVPWIVGVVVDWFTGLFSIGL